MEPPPQVIIATKPYRIVLSRTSKGAYSWDVSINGDNPEEVLGAVHDLDQRLRDSYGSST